MPKASYYDVVLNCKDLVAISVIAKDYGWSASRMNRYLHDKGIQYKQGNKIWLLYQKYAEKGYTSTKTHGYPANDGTVHTKVYTYWTQQGRLFIYDLLKADGILPTMEHHPRKMPGSMGVWQPHIRRNGCGNRKGEKAGQGYPLFHGKIGGGTDRCVIYPLLMDTAAMRRNGRTRPRLSMACAKG